MKMELPTKAGDVPASTVARARLPRSKVLQIVPAAVVVAMGAIVCAGWWMRVGSILRFTPDSGITQFNAALMLILLGLAEFAIVTGHRSRAAIVGGASLVLAGLDYLNTIANLGLGIDTLFARPFEMAGAMTPVTMPSAIAFIFVMLSVAIVLRTARRTEGAILTTITTVVYCVVGGLTIFGIVAYLTSGVVPVANARLNGPPLHLLLAFTLIIGSRLRTLWLRDVVGQDDLPQWFVPSLALGVLSTFFSMLAAVNVANRARIASVALTSNQALRLSISFLASLVLFLAIVVPVINLTRKKARIAAQKAYAAAKEMARREQAERDLQERNCELLLLNRDLSLSQQIVEHAPTAKILVGPDGKIALVNAETERLFGYSRTELLGRPIDMLVPERFRGQHPAWRGGFFADPKTRRMGAGRDLYGQRKDGTEVPIEIGLTPLETARGICALAAIIDITGRRQLEQQFRQVVEALSSAVVMSDANATIKLVNKAAEHLLGYNRSELLGKCFDDLSPADMRNELRASRAAFFANPKPRSMERTPFTIRTRDDREIPIDCALSPVETADGLMALSVFVDATEKLRFEERFRQVVESAPTGIVMINTQGIVTYLNAEAERLLAYRRTELLGQSIEVVTPDRFHLAMRETRATFFTNPKRYSIGPTPSAAHAMKRKDGSEFPVEYGVSPVQTDEGLMALTAFVDISQRRRLEERFRLVVEHAPSAMLMVDMAGTIQLVNAEAERMFGYRRSELVNQHWAMLVPERLRSELRTSNAAYVAKPSILRVQVWPFMPLMMRKDGTEFPVEYGATPVRADEGLMVLSAVVDISETVAARQKLESQAEDLKRSNAELEHFAYIASHDLKAPMRGIDNAAKWLESDLEGKLSDETRKIFDLMRGRVSRMERLLDDLLAYSRAGRTDTAVEETAVATLLDDIVQVLTIPPHINVTLAGAFPSIKTPRVQLELVLRNLIGNAIKHHDKPRGEVVVSARMMDDAVEFSVRDDGPGIAPEYHDSIFKLFHTLKRRDEVEGSGMGLAIVKKLVEQQRGTITVHSTGGGTGTEFRVLWPISAPAGNGAIKGENGV